MSWMMGAGLGFLRGGPLGAIVVGAVQHFISKAMKKKLEASLPGLANRQIFIASLVALVARVGIEKGPLSPREISVIRRFFTKNLDYASDDLSFVSDIAQQVQKARPDLMPIVEDYKKSSNNLYLSLALALAYQITMVGNGLNSQTQKIINQLADYLGLSYDAHDQVRRKYSLEALKTPYTILEIKSSASNEEIKKAYRKMASRFHPDRAGHDGGSPETAHLKFLEIQGAYQELERMREID
ncbi:MAG: DnaJ domain-containing protein [Candidatus Nitrohelix vancouverensis]|uniref:DnaJ domain-containing protein n=1 Tax=Candidatus Nitrohelix vancouverensis TaxID=2705534 RepID=A0A7T0C402_9BACT|nr:MAG: DnaJ domain-containing protein [Candidatus Nitrohelix vancouverensis]